MLNKLTKEQENLIDEVRDEWLDRFFGNLGREIDKDKCREGIEWLYKFTGLDKPEVIFIDSPMEAQFAANMLGRDQVGDQVGDQVRDQVWSQVQYQVRDQVRNDTGLSYSVFSSYGNISDFPWVSFLDYFYRVGVDLGSAKDAYFKLVNLIDSGIYDMIQFDGLAIVCRYPEQIIRDERNRLSNASGPAIGWSDGYELYFLDGVALPKDLHRRITEKEISGKEIIEIENIEQRMVAMKYRGMQFLLDDLGAKLLDKSSRGNELYLIEDVFSQPAYFLRYSCPSTDRVYMSGVDPEFAKVNPYADACMAWKHHFGVDVYSDLKNES